MSKEELISYADVLKNTLRVQNLLVRIYEERLKIYNRFFFTKRLLRAEHRFLRVLFSRPDKKQVQELISRLNMREQNILDIVKQNDPRKKLSSEAKIPKQVLRNLLSYYDKLLHKQENFLSIEKRWIANTATKQELLVAYTQFLEAAREYEVINRQEIRSHGNYLLALRGLLDAKKHNPKNLEGYLLYVVPFVALFDPFMDQYFLWAHNVPVTPLPNMDNVAILVVAIFLVYLDLPTKVGSVFKKPYDKALSFMKRQGWTY
ncbi:MAG: hypothetical protein ACMXYD_02475 [Candidatus Woesearchaeota archaeon]